MLKSNYLISVAFPNITADLYLINSLQFFDKSIVILEILSTEFSQPRPQKREDGKYTLRNS